ncbi:MAG: CehA/McbA family metallohydrolase [Nannocystaceae bacterium]
MRRAALPLALALTAAAPEAAAAPPPIVLEGEVPSGEPDHFFLDFEVAPGVVELQIAHDDLSDDDILDWGLEDPAGFRGWGGGNSEDAIVNADAASRSYLPGPITAGTWRVVVGKAKIVSAPAHYQVTITQRDAVTLAPQTERAPYVPADLGGGPRWLAGDLHVHSRESGDAKPTLDAIADFARGRGLDFVMISDHNTTSHLDYFVDAQARHPDLLFVPGMEFTTYDGHAGALGLTTWVDHKIGQPGVTITGAAQAIADEGAILSINHPALDLGDLCIGCGWQQALPTAQIGAVEIATTGLDKAGKFYTGPAITFWDQRCAEGIHVAAVGGSDDHKGGEDPGFFESPIGDPTTMVYAESLSAAAILAGIRAGRTVVKLQGPGDPMVELGAAALGDGDTVVADETTFTATVTGAPAGSTVRFVVNGAPQPAVEVIGDPFVHEAPALAPASGEDRWRAEVLIDGKVRTITSHLWLREDPSAGGTAGETEGASTGESTGTESGTSDGGSGEDESATTSGPGSEGGDGCACALPSPATPVAFAAAGLALLGFRRRRR